MGWLHTWVGLVLSVVLYFVFITGALGYFHEEIDYWMKPELPNAATLPEDLVMFETGFAHLLREAPNAKRWFVRPPTGRKRSGISYFAELSTHNSGSVDRFISGELDPWTGFSIEESVRETGGGDALYQMHYALHYIPEDFAIYVVGVATMFMLIALATGLVIHKKIFTDFFLLRLGKGQRSWLDAHNMTSVLALPFMLMITYSGLLYFDFSYFPGPAAMNVGMGYEVIDDLYEELYPGPETAEASGSAARIVDLIEPLETAHKLLPDGEIGYVEIINPGDAKAMIHVAASRPATLADGLAIVEFDGVSGDFIRIHEPEYSAAVATATVLYSVHNGRFANVALRWLYFLSGLLGAAMVATGLVLWAKKRRAKLVRRGVGGSGLHFVERTNVAIIVGLPLGIAAYFLANRLLPVGMDGRAAWEMHCLYLVWGVCFAHAAARETSRAWREQVIALALACAAIPIVNALTTDVHLAATAADGDWVRAGFDLTAITFSIALAMILCVLPRSVSGEGREGLGGAATNVVPQRRDS